ncbi:hypothetical protein [Saprospira grandis]|uniref:TonB-dependent receptor n=1 Tax=Saprospira grandis (strain Lewin) TaxID=984262 RepID=H6LAD5_SAPGL|nr:hypothetical protein [Saprospira grandis]AFC24420.1 TonB-dependent receptor [Saprospira grandis str. Lewin]
MNKLIPYFFLLLVGPIWGQSLSEPAVFQHYFKDDLRAARLYTDAGLGKYFWLAQQREPNLNYYGFDDYSLDHDGAFGSILLTPKHQPRLGIDLMGSHAGEFNGALRSRLDVDAMQVSLDVQGQYLNQIRDANEDGWQDQAQNQSFYLDNSWDVYSGRYHSNNNIQFLSLAQQEGQTAFLQGDTMAYGQELKLQQQQLSSHHLVGFRTKDLLLINLQYKDHMQQRNWGEREYEGEEVRLDVKARYEYHLKSELDIFRMQLDVVQNRFIERLDSQDFRRAERLLGGAVGYDTYWGPKWQLITHMQLHYHNLAGPQFSPQVKLNYQIHKEIKSNFFAGRSWRFANPLTEYADLLRTGRRIEVDSDWQAEELYYYGFALDVSHWWNLYYGPFGSFLSQLQFRWRQQLAPQEMVANLDEDPYLLSFDYLDEGQMGLRNSLEASGGINFSEPSLSLNFDYRYSRRWSYIADQRRELPLYSRHRLRLAARYVCRFRNWLTERPVSLFTIESILYLQSGQRLPNLGARGEAPERSPGFSRWDMELELPFNRWFSKSKFFKQTGFRLGVQQLLNRQQKTLIYGAEDPFSTDFEGGYQWGSTVGRRFYLHFRYQLM